MKSVCRLTMLVVALSVLANPAGAFFVGDAIEVPGGSWSLTGFFWNNDGLLTMDAFRGDIIPATGSQNFDIPGMTLGSSWTVPYSTPTFVQGMAGTPIGPQGDLAWTAKFADTPTDPLYTIWTSYSHGVWNEAFVLTKDSAFVFSGKSMVAIGSGYYGRSLAREDWDPGVVPEPTTLTTLLLLGLGAVGIRRRRMKKS